MKTFVKFLFFVLPFHLSAQESKKGFGTVRGIVSTADGQAAAWVSIVIIPDGRGTTTDEKGIFEIKKITPGSCSLHISLSGYIDTTVTVQIEADHRSYLEMHLQRTWAELQNVIIAADPHPVYVVTKTSDALRLNLPMLEVPQNIEVTTRQLLTDQGALSLTEAIRNVSGVVKNYGGLNDYYFTIRGFDAIWNVFRNGVGGYWWNQQEDAAMIESIDFIKGPAGFMLSVTPPGGLVNSNTKQPSIEKIASVNAGFGSFNMKRITADFGGAITVNTKLSYRLNAGFQSQDRSFQYSNASRYFICAALKYDFNEKTSLTAEYNFMQGITAGNNISQPSMNGKMFSLPRNFDVADAATDKLTTTDNYYRLQFKHRFNDNWHLYAQIAYVNGSYGGFLLDADGDIPVSNDTMYRASNYDHYTNRSFVAQGYTDIKFHTGKSFEHRVLFGFDYCQAGFQDSTGGTWGEKKYGLYLPNPQYAVSTDSLRKMTMDPRLTVRWGWTAFYLQDNLKVAEKLLLTLAAHFTYAPLHIQNQPGLPNDYPENSAGMILSPRAAVTWLFSDNFSIYTMYDQCFFPQQAKTFQNKVTAPLTGYDFEAGLKSYFFKKKLNLNLSVYRIVENNTLTADPLHAGDYITTGQVTSNGVEFDMTGNLTPALTVNANYAYTNARITKDTDPANIGLKNFGTPDDNGNLWLKYSLLRGKLKNLSFAIGGQFMGKRSAVWNWSPGDEIKFLPGYSLLDAAISYTTDKFYINLNVYNLTNTNYAAIGYFNSATSEWRYTPGEPVNVRLSFGINLARF